MRPSFGSNLPQIVTHICQKEPFLKPLGHKSSQMHQKPVKEPEIHDPQKSPSKAALQTDDALVIKLFHAVIPPETAEQPDHRPGGHQLADAFLLLV